MKRTQIHRYEILPESSTSGPLLLVEFNAHMYAARYARGTAPADINTQVAREGVQVDPYNQSTGQFCAGAPLLVYFVPPATLKLTEEQMQKKLAGISGKVEEFCCRDFNGGDLVSYVAVTLGLDRTFRTSRVAFFKGRELRWDSIAE